MAKISLKNFYGIHNRMSERQRAPFLEDSSNFDTNIEIGEMTQRNGYQNWVDVKTDDMGDSAFEYQDDEWNKDVLITYEKNATTANRRLWVYTRNFGDAASTYTKQGEYYYGSSELGDQLSFFAYKNSVRIGTGNGENNKALFAGYIDRTGDNGMFGNAAFDNADFYLLKQQWVQQASLLSRAGRVVYDSTRKKYYIITERGLEIRDEDFFIERILDDAVYLGGSALGGVSFNGDNLYVTGLVPGSNNYILVRYDMSNDYETLASITKTPNEYMIAVTTDGSNVFLLWADSGLSIGNIEKYNMDLTGAVNLYSGNESLSGIAYDSTYVYTNDTSAQNIVRVHKTTGATTNHNYAISSNRAGDIDIHADPLGNETLYFCLDNKIRSVPLSTFNSDSAVTSYDDDVNAVYFISDKPYVVTNAGYIVRSSGNAFVTDYYYPGKLHVNFNKSPGRSAGYYTSFYAVILEDIYGQYSHAMTGFAGSFNDSDLPVYLNIVLNAQSEAFSEISGMSPSQDPSQNVSIWGMYRRIKRVHLFKAYNSAGDQAHPTTDYRYLTSIDIDSSNWVVNNPSGSNYNYAYITYKDSTKVSELSSLTLQEFTGIPSDVKPYYTNWKYATEFQGYYYYANLFTDEQDKSRFIKSELSAPDMAYQTSTNFERFTTGESDEIMGLISTYSRLFVFKRYTTGVYNGSLRENILQIGTNAPRSLIRYNDEIYFTYQKAIYKVVPTGYTKVSIPIDDSLEAISDTDFSNTSAVFFKKKNKIWFMIGAGTACYLLNVNMNPPTWDKYVIDRVGATHKYIFTGYDGTIYTCADSFTGLVYKQDEGTTDDGFNFNVSFMTKWIEVGDGFNDYQFEEIFLTSYGSDDITITLYYQNETGRYTKQITFPGHAMSELFTQRRFIDAFGQSVAFSCSTNPTQGLIRIKALGLTVIRGAEIGV